VRLVKTKPKAVVRLAKPCKVTRLVKHTANTNKAHYVARVKHYAKKYFIRQDVALALVTRESGWNPNAVSHCGAKGLTQLMPATAKELGVDPLDPEQSIEGGMRYFRKQLDAAHNNYRVALITYNFGRGAYLNHKKYGYPLPEETRNYVAVILEGKKV
jgi:soluble lytic murein transglycosylase-like protein